MKKETDKKEVGSVGCYAPTKLGEACNLEQLRQIIGAFQGECPVRFDDKGPIEIYYSHNGYGGALIFR